MQRVQWPGAPFAVSVICAGAGNYGTGVSRDEAFEILDAFAEAGGNFADTAHVYADWLPEGKGVSERTLGAWVRSRGMRGRFVIGTKGGHPRLETMTVSRLSPAEITQDLTESLERLGTDTIDIYWLHRDDPAVPVGEILGVLNDHLAAGRVRALGNSNWTTARQEEANAYAARHGLAGFCASQIGWSLARVNPEYQGLNGMLYMDDPTWRWHAKTGMPAVAYTSQAQGFFSGKYRRGQAPPEGHPVGPMFFNEANFDRLERVQTLAGRLGRRPNAVALAYLFSQPFTGCAIAGARTAGQMEETCQAGDLHLSPAEVAFLEGGEQR